ncbi:Histone deacetylase 4, partial [Rhizopus azygosporus]
NYYPIDEERESVVKKRPLKITSIAALLNPEPPAHKPNVMRGVGGGTVKQADQDHIKRQHTRFSSAAAAADATQTDPKPVAPPGLICEMTCGELGIAVDTTFHPLYTSLSARIAAGSLLSLVESIVNGRLRNGFALIRPPGHHAEDDTAMGFCFYNNVAVAVADTLEKYPSKIKKILIIDWDIHHGNGTQKMFYDNPNVLYISLHRWDRGKFYPFTGAPEECGEGPGLGNNVNIAFSSSEDKPRPMGDTEFVAAFYYFVIPIARQFHPDMIFVSAGFDAAEGHPEN